MGTRTPNYDLYIPGQGEEAWDDEVGGNFTTIDAALQALADTIDGAVYQINNVTYVASNARWNGSAWNRVDTGRPAVRMMLNSTTGILEIATAAAGTNPISWTTIQAVSASGIDMKSKKIYNLATPTAATDAATKAYVDGSIAKVLPYRPETWPTETLDWGDVPAHPEVEHVPAGGHIVFYPGGTSVDLLVNGAVARYYTLSLKSRGGNNRLIGGEIRANGIKLLDITDGTDYISPEFIVPANATLSVYGKGDDVGYYNAVLTSLKTVDTGKYAGSKTFNLSGKWLALGIDMKGLAATVKIQGVEMPYSDYAKYFPLAPSELKIPGGWSPTQQRPVIKVYNI